MKNNNYYIYVYFDPTRDLEAFYVGKGRGRRSHSHLTRTDKHPFTHRLQRMARNGVIPLIERYEDLSENAAFDLEIALIAEIGRKDLGTGTLLNLTDGGEGGSNPSFETRAKIGTARKGTTHSDEARVKMSEAKRNMSDETKAKIGAARKGKTISDEHKAKISAANKGSKRTDEEKAKISAAHKGKTVSAETAAKISAAKKGKKHKYKEDKVVQIEMARTV